MRRFAPALLFALASPVFAAFPMQPGLWEITTTIQIPGVKIDIPPVVARQCFSAAQLKETEHPLPASPGCTITDSKHSGEITRWQMQCKMENSVMNATGEIHYSAQSYQGSARFSDSSGKKTETVVHRYSGKRLGACP